MLSVDVGGPRALAATTDAIPEGGVDERISQLSQGRRLVARAGGFGRRRRPVRSTTSEDDWTSQCSRSPGTEGRENSSVRDPAALLQAIEPSLRTRNSPPN